MGPRLRRLVTVPLVVLFVGACVSTADGPSPAEGDEFLTTTTSTRAGNGADDLEPSLTAFRGCLGDLGIEIEEIAVDGRGRPMMSRAMAGLDLDDRQTLDALGVCAPLLSAGALVSSTDPQVRDAVLSALEYFADCVRGLGVDGFPDPRRGFDGVGDPFNPSRVPWSDPDLAGAVAVCSDRMRETSP